MRNFSIRHIFFLITSLNVMLLMTFLYSYSLQESNSSSTQFNTLHFRPKDDSQQQQPQREERSKASGNVYRFDNPTLALKILEQLDIFSVVKLKKKVVPPTPETDSTYWHVRDSYCEEHRAVFVNYPEIVFTEKYFASDFWSTHSIRSQVFPLVGGKDMTPTQQRRKKSRPSMEYYRGFEDMRADITLFFMNKGPFRRMQIGKHFSCLSQVSNHIPGRETLATKDRVGNALVEYSKMYVTRPQCFNFESMFPKTWVLTKEEQCRDFFGEFTSPRYEEMKKERGLVYFRKIGNGVHQGHGVFPVNENEERYLKEKYQNGSLCGKESENNVMQYSVQNPLLLNGHKFHFRVYLFIASTNPIIAYYHDGYIRLSVNKYDPNSQDLDTFVTNLGITRSKAGDESAFQGMDQKEVKEATFWVYEQLQDYVLKNKLTSDPKWLDNHLRREFKKVMVHLIRMSKESFSRQSSLSELYGLDFLMDEKLDVWFIEANPMPLIAGWSDKTHKFFDNLLKDDFEIVLGLLKSRMKRVVLYLNEITKGISGDKKQDIKQLLSDIEVHRKKFQEITQNYFEAEFEPSPSNGFHKIMDENLEGTERYMGLFEKECL